MSIAAGAGRPYISPAEIAWRNILHLRSDPETSEILSIFFASNEYQSTRRFTRLHKLVIGIDRGDLEKELQLSSTSVDASDIDGWTPLHWAARRDNSDAVSLLLHYGANPFLRTDNESRSVLHLAAQGNSYGCVQQLLAYRRGNAVMDIEDKDSYGNTALRNAAGYNCGAACRLLLEKGASPNTRDKHKETPLHSAIYENAHAIIPQLIKAGADRRLTTSSGNTILHFAANEADLRTLAMLTKARLRDKDVQAQNCEGLTAHNLAQRRISPPHGYHDAFERLIGSIVEDDFDIDTPRSEASAVSSIESWKSFEDIVWYEAELTAAEEFLHAQEIHPAADTGELSDEGLETRQEEKLAAHGIDAHDELSQPQRATFDMV